MSGHGNSVDRTPEWDALKERYLQSVDERPPSVGNGLHHFAILSSDVETTIKFYQETLEFPLVEIFENRDYEGSTHFFFDIGHDNYLAYFDFPGLELGEYNEVLGGLHHIAIAVELATFDRLVGKLRESGIDVQIVNDSSAYFLGPDGERLELLTFPLNDMYGTIVK
ncbi:MAG: VOC family protein [Actinomycetes bacterium]|jgi:catechol 2,3-dioxygenase-like lactoylglutathione lyase family enzyme